MVLHQNWALYPKKKSKHSFLIERFLDRSSSLGSAWSQLLNRDWYLIFLYSHLIPWSHSSISSLELNSELESHQSPTLIWCICRRSLGDKERKESGGEKKKEISSQIPNWELLLQRDIFILFKRWCVLMCMCIYYSVHIEVRTPEHRVGDLA